MANNYRQFSFAIPLNTEEEKDWARRAVDWLEAANETGIGAPGEFESLVPDDGYLDLDFVCEVEEDGLWIYSEETGTPETVVPLVRAFLKRFRPEGSLGFCWADWCSRPRLDEFGGGAVFITATEDRWVTTDQWLSEQS